MSTQNKIITILLADDHQLTRQGCRAILDKVPDMKIVGEAQDGDEIKQLVEKLRPKILLLDLKMPNLSPAVIEEWVRTNYPETATLILTAHDRDFYLSAMMDAGAAGYFDKKIRASQLVSAIRRAANGEILFDKRQIERVRRWREDIGNMWNNLSGRERDVLQILTEGADNQAIAVALDVTINTVEKHLTNIYKKLGVTSRTEATLWWLEKGGDFRN